MLGRFLKTQDGSASVEYALWLVVMIFILMMAADASMLLAKHAELFDIARDIARQYALGQITTAAEVDTVLQLRFPDSSAYTATATTESGFAVVSIKIGFSDVLVFGDAFLPERVLEGRVVMAMESTS